MKQAVKQAVSQWVSEYSGKIWSELIWWHHNHNSDNSTKHKTAQQSTKSNQLLLNKKPKKPHMGRGRRGEKYCLTRGCYDGTSEAWQDIISHTFYRYAHILSTSTYTIDFFFFLLHASYYYATDWVHTITSIAWMIWSCKRYVTLQYHSPTRHSGLSLRELDYCFGPFGCRARRTSTVSLQKQRLSILCSSCYSSILVDCPIDW